MANDSLQQKQKLDALAVQFESAWRDGRISPWEFLRNTPNDLPTIEALKELIQVEISLRAAANERIEAHEYVPLDPAWIESLISHYGEGFDQETKSINSPSEDSREDDATLTLTPNSSGQQPTKTDSGGLGGYEIISEIARGGMGVVYKARQTRLNRMVALKMIKSGEFAGKEEIKRFHAEAEAAALLDHPGIVPIHEIGKHEGNPFFSMGLVEGESLSAKLREGPMQPRAAAELVKKISEAIAFAHDAGVIHRDLKPGNVLIDQDGNPKVTDFGLAKNLAGDSELTGTGQILGTPSYMPPEQASGDTAKVDERADVYALGAILYSTLVNRPPFQAPTPMETLKQVLDREPVSPRTLDLKISRDLETICLKCLRKEPDKRYLGATELAEDIGRWLRNEPIVARRVGRVEKSWMWCKRHPVAALSSVAVVIALLIGSLIAYEWRNRSRADALVNGLVGAEPARVMDFADQLADYHRWAVGDLTDLAAQTPTNPADRRQLHAQMALVRHDPDFVDPLVEELLDAAPEYLSPTSLSLTEHTATVAPQLWVVLHGESESVDRRFRAAAVLASFEPESSFWTKADFQLIVDQLVALNPVHQPQFWPFLPDIDKQLLPSLEKIFKDPNQPESAQMAATNTIAYLAESDSERLFNLLTFATPDQFSVLYPMVEANPPPAEVDELARIAAELPPDELGSEERITFGRRRANAAVTLLRMGEVEKVLSVFEWTDDPEALTQFVFRCRERNVGVDSLLKCLDVVNSAPADRYPADTRYGLLLTLGEFKLEEIAETQREKLLTQIADWYANDPNSGVHGAAGWLLRKWDQTETAQNIEQTEVPYSPDREWFTLKIQVQPAKTGGQSIPPKKTFYYTFIVFPAGEYWIGSVEDEPDRKVDETRHVVELKQPFALLDREITFSDLIAFDAQYLAAMQDPEINTQPNDAGSTPNWYQAVAFSRWLGQRMGLPEDQQAYASPDSLDKDVYPRESDRYANWAPRNWPVNLEKQGFRLPSELEWEVVARAGSRTAYGFGSDISLLGRFGWFNENSRKKVHPPRELRPSMRGLFDIHGNLYEWTHDWLRESLGSPRAIRGGSWTGPAVFSRSAFRSGLTPSLRSKSSGFRVALSLLVESREAQQETSESGGEGTEGASAEQRPEKP